MEDLFRVLLLVAAAMALPISLLSRPLAELLFGPEFRDTGPVLSVHVWAGVFVALGIASSQYLVLEDLVRISAQRTLVGAVLNIVLNLLWIPRYGALGCAWATLISYAVASVFLFQTPSSRLCLALMARALRPGRRPA
jgi:O-antigen/teichoic acid export membrane protein